jgi:hypothetical protein
MCELGSMDVFLDRGEGRYTVSRAYYYQECPTCGRNLKVRVEYLGKNVRCQHCHARFEACDPDSAAYPPSNSGLALLRRAEELLETAAGTERATV